jgi:hypothetical protein
MEGRRALGFNLLVSRRRRKYGRETSLVSDREGDLRNLSMMKAEDYDSTEWG